MRLEKKKLKELVPADYNPRKISSKAKKGLTESIERFGLVQPIVWNERTNRIVGGHQRYDILLEKDVKETTVMVVDLEEEDELILNIALNNPEIQGEWTASVNDILNAVKKTGNDLYDSLRLDDLEYALDKIQGFNCTCPSCNFKWKLDKFDMRPIQQEDYPRDDSEEDEEDE